MLVKSRLITALAATAAMALVPSIALAQRQPPPSPDQRIDRLERQVQQMQRQVFPKGRPADSAGFSDDPAASQSSVVTLDQRLDALERQMADLIRQSEENANRLRTVEAGLGQMKSDQDQRISALEQKMSEAATAAPAQAAETAAPPASAPVKSKTTAPKTNSPKTTPGKKIVETQAPPEGGPLVATAAADEGEDAYSQGFRLWQAGQFDEAITQLKAFASAYPKHRRASYANNLIGRALLDKGDARAAATALLANYRSNPGGERAQDSLYYLGQALMKLGQPGQACKAYSELDAVYGAKIRPDLKKLESDGKAQAQCS
jgi:TolA-binding protein